jgi:phage shock protein A
MTQLAPLEAPAGRVLVGECLPPRPSASGSVPPRPAPRTQPRRHSERRLQARKELGIMTIFSRTRDIVAANFSDLLDHAEDPAKMIRMIIMEMEETLVEVRASAARSIADQKEMRARIARLERLQEGWAEKAEFALSKDREDLARAALVEKQKAADAAEALTAEIAMLDGALRASEADISRLQQKLLDARTRQNAIRSRIEHANNRARLREMAAGPKVDEAFSRFEVLERRADLAEGHAEALALAAPKSLDEEIAELRVAERVETELEELKARRSHEGA